MARRFIDEVEIRLKAGDGGSGSASFFRGPHIPKGGPDGGDGGRGGSIFLVGSPHLQSLLDFKYLGEFKAQRGEDGRGKQCYGKSGEDLMIEVPLGTQITDENGDLVGDITEENQTLLAAKGGKGGLGNVHFKSSVRQAPRIFTKGDLGEEKHLRLELKSLSDIGFVGYPNAGKSSLLRALTSAQPKVGAYPFTTLQPQLGILQIEEMNIRLADIPGLIEGASEDRGLGHRFLRHISRSKALLFVLAFDSDLSLVNQFENLRKEMEQGHEELLSLPYLVVANKSDLLEQNDQDLIEIWEEEWEDLKSREKSSCLISAEHHLGLEELKGQMKALLTQKQTVLSLNQA